MKFYLVDVKTISPAKNREQFDEADLVKIADLILDCDGLLKPLVLKPTGPESYVIVEGDKEYYASVIAREKNPRKGEMVNAFVISPKKEDIIVEQLKLLHGETNPDGNMDIKPIENNSPLAAMKSIEVQLKSIINHKFEQLLSQFNLLTVQLENTIKSNNQLFLDKIDEVNKKVDNIVTKPTIKGKTKAPKKDIDNVDAALELLRDCKSQDDVNNTLSRIKNVPLLRKLAGKIGVVDVKSRDKRDVIMCKIIEYYKYL